ncbi:MAG: DUF763 domain-containing protein [Candidatus Doudnabacteria bacterium]|nr:DUF763 domain-containing protein [Candidatus Doudnabacteria bacterium]
MNRGIATFTLDFGKCPPWLWQRMVRLGREIVRVLVEEYGPEEFIRRISDPVWFQSLGTVLAFDWNASGLTTILTAALKESIRGRERDLGIFICGGKGKTSRKTPDEVMAWGDKLNLPKNYANSLVHNSKMSAKVDSALVQDGFQIYHHSLFFTKKGVWSVVQQGMNTENQTARRYHWFSENVHDMIQEPHAGIASQKFFKKIELNMTSKDSNKNRDLSVDLVNDSFRNVMKDIELLRRHSTRFSQMLSVQKGNETLTLMNLENREFGPSDHPVIHEDFSRSRYLEKILFKLTDAKPKSYQELLLTQGVGPKTIRALALVGEVIYGADASREDPARFSFAHGGKDATPYPVDTQTYDQTIQVLRSAVSKSRIDLSEKKKAIKRLDHEAS